MKYNLALSGMLLLLNCMLFSCAETEGGGFAPSIIGIVITVVFSIAVLYFFLFRKQNKRKGDDNPKP